MPMATERLPPERATTMTVPIHSTRPTRAVTPALCHIGQHSMHWFPFLAQPSAHTAHSALANHNHAHALSVSRRRTCKPRCSDSVCSAYPVVPSLHTAVPSCTTQASSEGHLWNVVSVLSPVKRVSSWNAEGESRTGGCVALVAV